MNNVNKRRLNFLKKERLRRKSEYSRIFKDGTRYRSKHFNLLIAPSEEGIARLGIVVGRKTGNAVVRNRTKRLIREIFRKNKILFCPNKDYLFVSKNVKKDLSYLDVFEEIKPILVLDSQKIR